MNDRNDRPENSGRPRRSNQGGFNSSRGGGRREDNNRPFRGDRDSSSERRPYRGNRDDRAFRDDRNDRKDRGYQGDRNAARRGDRDDRGYRGDREDRGGNTGYRGNRDSGGERRPFRGDRDERGGGGYRGNRESTGERRSFRDDRNDRGGFRNDRNGRGERKSFGGNRDDRGGSSNDRNDRGGFRGGRDDRGGFRNERNDRNDRGDRRPFRDGDDREGRGGYRNDRNDRNDRSDRNDRGGFRGGRGERSDRGGSYGRGGTRGGGRSDRGGAEREFTEAERLQHSLRPVRSEHDDPIIAEHIQPSDLHPSARNELKTLQVEVQERVSLHLAMVALLIDDDPELAHQHAISASRRAGRIPVVRETLAMTAYRTGDYALAIRELRTFRRLSGRDSHIAIMVDSERGLGRPEKAIETGLEVDRSKLKTVDRVHLAIAMSGARLDLGQTQQALFELEIPELDSSQAFSWSPDLFGAYAAVLEDLGRVEESAQWFAHADRAAAALVDHFGGLDELEVVEIYEDAYANELDDEPGSEGENERENERGESRAPEVGAVDESSEEQ